MNMNSAFSAAKTVENSSKPEEIRQEIQSVDRGIHDSRCKIISYVKFAVKNAIHYLISLSFFGLID